MEAIAEVLIAGLIFGALVILFVVMSCIAASSDAENDYKNMGKVKTEDDDEDPSIWFGLIDEDENNKTE